jgi:hypothetical protein
MKRWLSSVGFHALALAVTVPIAFVIVLWGGFFLFFAERTRSPDRRLVFEGLIVLAGAIVVLPQVAIGWAMSRRLPPATAVASEPPPPPWPSPPGGRRSGRRRSRCRTRRSSLRG